MDKLQENLNKIENYQNKKRKLSSSNENSDDDEDNLQPATKILIEEASSINLTEFCDEVLIEILSYLDSKSLLNIGRTCHRMQLLTRDNRLWKYIDLTDEQLPLDEIKKRLLRVSDHTKSVKIRGMVEKFPLDTWKNVTISESLLEHITQSCENLQTLELHHSFINTETIDITHFPPKLKRLVFNDCYVRWPNTPAILFTRIDTHLKELEELHIEFCNWFNTHDLVAFSKVVNLKRLSIRGCSDLKEFVPYGSIAARFGFKKLEFLDLRETPITDSDLQCFNILQNLKELQVECPPELRHKTQRENDTVSRQIIQQRPLQLHRPDRPADALQPGRFFIVNFVINPNNPDRPVDPPGGGPIPQMHELHPGREQEQIENALRAILPHGREVAAAGGSGRRRAASIYFAPARITDRGVCSYGTARIPVQNVVCIRAEPREPDTNIEKLIIRYYKYVTDISLRHLVQCAPKLKYLDLTGTGVTEEGINIFKIEKPDCQIISDFLTG